MGGVGTIRHPCESGVGWGPLRGIANFPTLPPILLLLAAALVAILVTTGCAVSDGKLRVGITGDYPPFNYVNEAGKFTGLDVNIARALCDQMEVRCLFQRHAWALLIPKLRNREFDAIIASMSITEKRRRMVAFTDRCYSSRSRFVT